MAAEPRRGLARGTWATRPATIAMASVEAAGQRIRVRDGEAGLSPETWGDRANLRLTADAVVGAVLAG